MFMIRPLDSGILITISRLRHRRGGSCFTVTSKADGTFSNSSAGQLALGCRWRADLQLTQYEGDGVKFKRLAFSDGGAKEITYSPRVAGITPGTPIN
jgi:hypothetical protein